MTARDTPLPVEVTLAPEPKDLAEVLRRLDAWYARYVPAVHATLRPGVRDAELDAFEKRSGLTLPADFRALYRWHDGQNWSVGGVLGLAFMPLNEVEHDWKGWKDIAEENASMNVEIYTVSHPTGAIREQYASPGWIPFLSDGGGNFVGVDLWPDVTGQVGQVMTSGRDEEHRFVLAPDVSTFLRTYLQRLEEARLELKKLGGYEGDMWSVELKGENGMALDGYQLLAELYPGFGHSPRNRREDGPAEEPSWPELMERLERWLQAHHPDLWSTLPAGASPAQLKAAAERLGRELPEEVAYLYSRHADWGEVLGLPFIPIDELGRQDSATFGLPDAQGRVVPFNSYTSSSGPQDWLPLWILNGDHVGVNRAGHGEIRTFGPNARPRYVLAENLWRLLERQVRFLEAGLVRREGQRLVLPDARGQFFVNRVEDAWPGFGLSPAVREKR
ncbi:SMI1/KNR4 family protein [Deinococcus fonticola]|uniref:SMI1/KNR4 family protein n=1 Tax=Deinococcus fonticola TaxID=2528713 RepID=UPI0010750E83|nr:SMI1/KNR4 family protein [Deinococcus fonticola]